MDTKKFLIIYHKEDNDGIISAAIAKKFLEDNYDNADISLKGADYVAMSYVTKDVVDNWDECYDMVVMTDISCDSMMMQYIYNVLKGKFVWVDHHAPAINESYKHSYMDAFGLRETSRSAILLMFSYLYDPLNDFYNDGKVPEILRILSAWDSFTFEREGYSTDYARNVNTGVTSYYALDISRVSKFIENIIDNWKKCKDNIPEDNDNIKYFYELGKTISDNDDMRNANIIANDGDMSWTVDGHSACALFIQGQSSSLMFKSLLGKARHGIVFKRKKDGQWAMSLYNIDNNDAFHCGEYLKEKYHGGGHKGAAGCTFSLSEFIKLLKTKTL